MLEEYSLGRKFGVPLYSTGQSTTFPASNAPGALNRRRARDESRQDGRAEVT
jgi:hypothetical protein